MSNTSVAELKARFDQMNALPHSKRRAGTINNEPSSDPPVSGKLKHETSNQSSDNASRKTSDPIAAASQTSNGTASSRDAILARHHQFGANGTSSFKKLPVPLPRQITHRRNKNVATESLPAPPNPLLQQISSPKTNTSITSTHSPVVSLPTADPNESIYVELPDDLSTPTPSSVVSENGVFYESFETSSISLPNSIPVAQHKNSRFELSSVSLETMLPSKCMFSELETTIYEYQRRDPRTIIYPRIKPTPPKMTSNELSTLQRYSNT